MVGGTAEVHTLYVCTYYHMRYVLVIENSERRLSMYARERIRQLLAEGYTCSQVVTQEGIRTCRQTVWRLEGHFKVHGTITPLPKSGKPTKLTDVAPQKIDDAG